MSLQARRELLNSLRPRYREANKTQKKKILDEFIQVTNYGRKHAIALLNKDVSQTLRSRCNGRQRKYDSSVKEALIQVWHAANEICSKRLVPFLPEFLEALDRTGQWQVTPAVREKLLSMCPATADQLLASERRVSRGKSTTRSGTLLKRQIPIRTFSDWNDVEPGFFEADLVAHCGVDPSGRFLNTLVLVDIATSWLECFALLQKSEAEVINALQNAQALLPVTILGFDSDNGSEFINHGLIDFCKEHQITFTRSRAYKKNDQAHVEERNGSVVRKTIGYDRYEGYIARDALQMLYQTMRLYVNFFQPTMKLISKQRVGAKVSRQYDSAQTPYRRMLNAPHVSDKAKSALREIYSRLDPIELLKELETLQDALWKHAWRQMPNPENILDSHELRISILPAVNEAIQVQPAKRSRKVQKEILIVRTATKVQPAEIPRKYRKTRKPRNPSKQHTWRTRKDPFEQAAEEIETQFHQNQNVTARQLLAELEKKFPGCFSEAQIRTLMRRLNNLRNLRDGHAIPPPVRQTYPKHIKSREKLSPAHWQQVNEAVVSNFNQNSALSCKELLLILQKRFPELITEAQLPTLRRRLSKLRKGVAKTAMVALK